MSDNYDTFKLLKPEVGKAIYDLKWETFRPIQDISINKIVQSKKNIIISAPTAGGKTEAAFLPAISESIPEINQSLKIVYISPLKALINDQILRIENLCRYLNCKIARWHGDASQSKKKKFLTSPSGIILITPESLESFLINRNSIIYNFFKQVDFYIIDEIHSFVGGSRGEQLKSVLNRIDSITKKTPRRILLSATMGSLENYKTWLDDNEPIVIKNKNEGKGIKGSVRFFEDDNRGNYLRELINITSSGKQLVFANSKRQLETTCVDIKSITQKSFNKKIDIHHGSLSKEHREYVEKRLRTEANISVFCTNTLELGIDIGNIDEVLLISAPWSVSSFIQKIGRSGRKENSKTEFSFVLSNLPVKDHSHICDGLRCELIQSIALIELMLSGWCEPGNAQTNSYSTFVHQVMAFLAQKRETTSEEIWTEIIKTSFSNKVSHTDFKDIINHLIEQNYIRKEPKNILILEDKGDKLTEHYDFYSVFFTPEEWTIYDESKKLGTIPLQNIFQEGDTILFAGKKWRVKIIDYQSKTLQVAKAKGGNPPLFGGYGGMIHPQIHKKMKNIYESKESYKYLTDEAEKYLKLSKQTYQKLIKSENFLPIFKGSGTCKLVSFILRSKGIEFDEIDTDIGIYLKDFNRVKTIKLLKEFNTIQRIDSLLDNIPLEKLYLEKYDHLLPKLILRKSFINSAFDIKHFLAYIEFMNQSV